MAVESAAAGIGQGPTADRLDAATANPAATRRHIRGSSLLLVGRLIALAQNFAVQILTVRYLGKAEFGAFGFAIAVESMASSIAILGLDKAVARFVPVYHERGDYARMFGTIALTLGSMVAIGLALVVITLATAPTLVPMVIDDPLVIGVVLIMIGMAPLNALDNWFQGMFAVFADPKAIFVRRHLLAPGLRLLTVLAVMASGAGVKWLAFGYVVGGVIGVATYGSLLFRLFQRTGIWAHFRLSDLRFPVREVFGFSMPLLTSDVLMILKSNIVVLLLGYYWSTLDVAAFRAVWPVAGLNLVVMQSFRFMYTPLAARLFARNDRIGINDLYWRTAIWMALMSFPVFAASFALATPVTVLLFGDRYADSATVLAILAFGNYFNAALGFNAYTLRVYGKVRYIVAIDVVSALVNVILSLTLIPAYGALGAAIATCATLVVYNVLNQAGLLLGTGVHVFERRYLRVYGGITVAALLLLLVQEAVHPPFVLSAALVGLATFVLLRLYRRVLAIGDLFPELRRIAILRPLLGD